MAKIIGCKAFTVETAKNAESDVLGKQITDWIQKNPFSVIEDKVVTQSDSYISVMLFISGKPGAVNPLDGI